VREREKEVEFRRRKRMTKVEFEVMKVSLQWYLVDLLLLLL